MSITKMRLSDKNVCKVTFTAPSNVSESAKKVYLVGEFNNWELPGLLMKKKNGKFTITLRLDVNKEYQFRYLVDGVQWETDWEADKQVLIPWLDEYNSVVIV
jgi:1,4-alpha-glucan branching enzyme